MGIHDGRIQKMSLADMYHAASEYDAIQMRLWKRKEKKRKEKKRKEKKRKDYASRRQFNEKPSIIPGCPDDALVIVCHKEHC